MRRSEIIDIKRYSSNGKNRDTKEFFARVILKIKNAFRTVKAKGVVNPFGEKVSLHALYSDS